LGSSSTTRTVRDMTFLPWPPVRPSAALRPLKDFFIAASES
jgi:hypothetical protein